MAVSDKIIKCECGRTEAVFGGGVTVVRMRCPLCPKPEPKPVLRLVKS